MNYMESNTDSSRALASIQIIDTIEPHDNADSLELANILGWQIIVRKGEVVPGARVIYCEIDSLLPIDSKWLPPAIQQRIIKEKTKNFFRIKTIKLRGQLSQGLIVPITDELPSMFNDISWSELDVGYNVTDILKIEKYEPPSLTGKFSYNNCENHKPSNFPSKIIAKTDEPRVQSSPKLFSALQGKPYYMTVKLDGTSVTYLLDTDEFLVCSRNMIRTKPDDINTCPYWYVAIKYDIENKLRANPNLAIQGEICGPNIQRNLLGLKELELFIFNVVDISLKHRLPYTEMITACKETLQLPHVPIEEIGEEFLFENIKVLLNKSTGTYQGTKNYREGLVVRSIDQLISFKVISNDYLLKYGH